MTKKSLIDLLSNLSDDDLIKFRTNDYTGCIYDYTDHDSPISISNEIDLNTNKNIKILVIADSIADNRQEYSIDEMNKFKSCNGYKV